MQLTLPFTTFHKFNQLDIEILTYSYLNLKVRIQRRLAVCLLKKKIFIYGDQYSSNLLCSRVNCILCAAP